MMRNKQKSGVARLLQLCKEQQGIMLLSVLVSAISALALLVPYIAVYFIIRELLLHAGNIQEMDQSVVIAWGVAALIGLIIGLFTAYVSGMASHWAAFRVLRSLRTRLAEHVGKLPLGFFSRKSTGSIKKTIEYNVEKIEVFIAHQIPDVVQMVVTLLAIIVAMFILDPWLALLSLLPLVLGFAAQMLTMGQGKAQQYVKAYHDALENMNSSAVQYVKGMPAIRMFGQSVTSFRRFHKDIVAYRDFCLAYTDRYKHSYVVFKVLMSSYVAFLLPAAILGTSGQVHNQAFAAVLVFFFVMAPGIAAPAFRLMFLSSSLGDIKESVERIDLVFQEQPMSEPLQPKQPSSYSIEFDQVSFHYNDDATARAALSNVTFVAKQNEITAFVGHSGAGKSTVAALIPRFWDVQQGAVRIGGIDIREISSHDLMEIVAFVFQESFLFHDSVYNNIAMGRPSASRQEIYAAAEAAQCHYFIERLPNQYETIIGDGGVHLSGGEQQRLAVARAILKNAPILVLDEATAFADPENEYEMQLALSKLIQNKTVLIIAHRLSTIRDADQIIVMQEGHIVEQGCHQELIEKKAIYAAMWNDYTRAEDWQIKDELRRRR